MRRVMLGLAILPFLAISASAGQLLNDGQMDRISAGAAFGLDLIGLAFTNWPPPITAGPANSTCAGCTSQTSGAVFAPSSAQNLFLDLGSFLLQQGYPQ